MSGPALQAITGFRLVTPDLARLARHYVEALGATLEGAPQPILAAEMAMLGLAGGGMRQRLRLGAGSLAFDQFERPGRAYPQAGDAAALWFQHLALVVGDIAAVHARLGAFGAAISEGGPQALPASSGGVTAFKFRDPDGHPLELLQFPAGGAPEAWRGGGAGVLGIDHSAISVSNAAASEAYYAVLGLSVGKRTLNAGPEQQRLDGLAGVQVDVVPMLPGAGVPHLELLGYRQPRGARAMWQANDVAATRIVWRGAGAGLLVDPDGHLQQIDDEARQGALPLDPTKA